MTHILVVDDEASIRHTIEIFLREDGYVVETAENGEAARKLVAANSYDVVITDIIMPLVSGVTLMNEIRTKTPDVQVIVITGEPTVETAAAAVHAGACEYLSKPFSRETLLHTVASAAKLKHLCDERRRLLETNRLYQEQLERLVKKGDQALQNAMHELEQAQKQILQQERLKALGQMASGIAHDFSNVLMPILGLPALLLANPAMLDDKAEVTRMLLGIQNAAQDAREIVRRLREFYRPEEQPERHPIVVGDLFARVASLTELAWKTQAQAGKKNIRLEIDCKAGATVVVGNEAALREMLVNLVLNAVAAIEQDGLIRLTAATEGAWAVLRVSDTGAGMSEDVRLHCFEPFFSTKGAHGSGLGLAMCHGIAQRHGGQITVDSQLGRGAVFTIRLPHHAAATVDYAEAEVSPPSAAENPPTTLHLRVLAIDDEVLSLTLVSRYLTAKGHAVETASSGAEALTKLRAHCYDAVVTDRAMAGIGGDEIARIIQQITPSTPVLMLTGFGDLMNFKSERPRGVDAVIGKPVTPDELNLAVEQLVRRRRGDKCVGG